MNILNVLYTLTIGPLKLLFEVIFNFANNFFVNPGLSIICLSFALNIILLPLYNRADTIQAKENEIQKKLKPGVDHIKKSFKGDEQYMILQTYYRQNNYKPIYALRSLTSLLLQIPFFIAAADFLSDLKLLDNQSFIIIKNLAAPDGLLFGLNLLPIAMTIINIINCLVYTKGQPLKSKIQLYSMALVFLVLLYNSPAGLSFYYLLNNAFSLIKNLFLKVRNKKKVASLVILLISISILIFDIFFAENSFKARIMVGAVAGILFIISVLLLIDIKIPNIDFNGINVSNNSFIFIMVFMCLLLGLFIPTRVINASPEEFVDMSNYVNPVEYIVYSFSLAFGTFIIWFNVYYALMSSRIQKTIAIIFNILAFVFLINYLFFGTNLGTMTNTLVYDDSPTFTIREHILNIISSMIICVCVLLILKKKQKLLPSLIIVICCTFVALSSFDIYKINKVVTDAHDRYMSHEHNLEIPNLNFSKNGKNVVVIMLDRAIGPFLSYIVEEKPELKEGFDGFVYYPNTISFGAHTNFSVSSLFGGYEYTPEELNKRDKELLVDKHNEALLSMPVLFNQNGFGITICDPPYAGYKQIPDLSIYDDYIGINSYITEGKFYTNNYLPKKLRRDLFCFGIMKCSPPLLQHYLYNQGLYLECDAVDDTDFQSRISTLKNLITMTNITDNQIGEFIEFQNLTTHSTHVVFDNTTNFGVDCGLNLKTVQQKTSYYTNVSSYYELAKWFDYLKSNGVYDNTRIVICSDHGYNLGVYPDLVLSEIQDDDLMIYNPLLMVKDFDNKGFRIDESFMTLADIPYLATKDIIENPINPFTKKAIEEMDKNNKLFYVIRSPEYDVEVNNGATFLPSKWYAIHDDCRDVSNWKMVDNIK